MIYEYSYKGYEITINKECGLTSFSVFRESDYLEVISDFTEGTDTVTEIRKGLQERIVQFILTKGASECREEDY